MFGTARVVGTAEKNNFIRAFELPALDFALSDKALQVRSQQVNNKRGGVAG
jgi:hypothetical protein